jgi:hypothetical protein
MQFVPTCCDTCAHVGLFPKAECESGRFPCAWCTGEAHVLPGCGYAAHDIALFSELAELVAETGIKPYDAGLWASEVEDACAAGTYAKKLAELARRMPLLRQASLVLKSHPSRQRVALGMLGTIFNALATSGRAATAVALPPAQVSCDGLG